MRTGLTGFHEDIRKHLLLLGERVPSFRRVLGEVSGLVDTDGDPAIRKRLTRAWSEREFHAYYDRPALLLTAIRADALAEGSMDPLWRAMAVDEPDPAAVTSDTVRQALGPKHTRLWRLLAERRVQTNETARAITWLWPAWLAGCDGGARPLAIVDIGASAGLNLVADRLPAIWHDPGHTPIPVARQVDTVVRLGLDARPIDVRDADQIGWLRACLWPGERARRERFEAALAAMQDAVGKPRGPVLEKANVADAPKRLVRLASEIPKGTLILAYQTIVRAYLEPAVRAAYVSGMNAWLAKRPYGQALWMELEMAPDDARPVHAVITAHVKANDGAVCAIEIARCGYHPVEVTPKPAGVAELTRLLDGGRDGQPE